MNLVTVTLTLTEGTLRRVAAMLAEEGADTRANADYAFEKGDTKGGSHLHDIARTIEAAARATNPDKKG